ncbi:MAG: hypothetical protein KKD46_01590 [Euryarchaeota archaeon]|nr:hypothetical protein [Euryarchaeota archaeon]MBU4339602.1 hypothetical protein [Euryarchaeota archaeon]MCG2735015.1 hypothetical protein [Candidatus Methanoperedenaceae archaeon]
MKSFEIQSHILPSRIYGIDFSGAKDAGKKIWVAGGRIEGNVVNIEECWRASELHGAGNERERCLTALRGFIAKETDSAIGIDFPFGLPLAMVKEKSWEDFVIRFPEHYGSAGDFREKCKKAAPDSVIAAYATSCALHDHFAVEINKNYCIEGYVFV